MATGPGTEKRQGTSAAPTPSAADAASALRSALRGLAPDEAARAALGQHIQAAFEAALRSQRRTVSRLAAVRALKAEAATLKGGAVSVVPALHAVRDMRLAETSASAEVASDGGGPEGAAAEAVRRSCDALVLHFVRSARDEDMRRARGAGAADQVRTTLDRLLRVVPDAVFTVRSSGRVGLWSVGASRLSGRRRYDVQRRGLARCFSEPEAWEALLADVAREGRVDGRELSLQHASGLGVPVRVHGAHLRRRGAQRTQDPERLLFVLQDRTEIHRIRARLIETEKLSAMAKIAGSVAHEFRNPLNSLFLSTDLLEDELDGQPAVRRSIAPTLAAIREEIERLNQIITHYLALSHIGGDEAEELDLGAQVAEFVEAQRERVHERSLTIRVKADAGPHPIRVDRHQLHRVLVNLVENALDAVTGDESSGTRAGTVTVLVRRMRRSAKLTVKDNGPGIPEDLRQRVLEPFYTSKAGGSGLGLYLVREIALASGGSMSLSSQEGRGTSVSLRWPLTEGATETAT